MAHGAGVSDHRQRVQGAAQARAVRRANYDLDPPSRDVTKPVGPWNETRIVARGAHVEHWLNGVKVVEYELWTPTWERQVATSKFKDFPKFGRARRGHIGLQDHGDLVAFRNIKIRELKNQARPRRVCHLWVPRRPRGQARGASIPGVCKRRATPPRGMHRQPEWCNYS